MADNATGAACAEAALDRYREKQGYTLSWETDIVDLMTDLLHLAQTKGCDCQAMTDKAKLHFEAEHGIKPRKR
jgi:hypothetical protein